MRQISRGIGLILLLAGLVGGLSSYPASGQPAEWRGAIYIPAVFKTAELAHPLIIDHTMQDITRIPDYWIEQARQITFHYAHTSHGSQIVTGLEWLAQQDPRYSFAVRYGGPAGLPDAPGALRFYDGFPDNTYITPDLYWASEGGVNSTRAVAGTGLFKYSMWSWCGQQSDNSVETVQQYLDTLNQLETEYPAMRFIYMTGHTDWSTANAGSVLMRNNALVKQYALEHNKILFDFADFELYDPGGAYHPEATDACPWCPAWCSQHPADCANFETMGDCAHTQKLICKIKAQAFWWMAARLAGWEGN